MTTNAPVFVLVLLSGEVTVKCVLVPPPEIVNAPPTFKFPPIPTPPSTTNAPDEVPVLEALLLICV